MREKILSIMKQAVDSANRVDIDEYPERLDKIAETQTDRILSLLPGEKEGKFFIPCPFCHEKDFDQIGLKNHFLKGHCEEYNKTALLP